jgi:hypothetical protein
MAARVALGGIFDSYGYDTLEPYCAGARTSVCALKRALAAYWRLPSLRWNH